MKASDLLGERMGPDQEDYIAGRTKFQMREALKAKKIRNWITAHPNCNTFDLRQQFGVRGWQKSIKWLLRRRMIKLVEGNFSTVPM